MFVALRFHLYGVVNTPREFQWKRLLASSKKSLYILPSGKDRSYSSSGPAQFPVSRSVAARTTCPVVLIELPCSGCIMVIVRSYSYVPRPGRRETTKGARARIRGEQEERRRAEVAGIQPRFVVVELAGGRALWLRLTEIRLNCPVTAEDIQCRQTRVSSRLGVIGNALWHVCRSCLLAAFSSLRGYLSSSRVYWPFPYETRLSKACLS